MGHLQRQGEFRPSLRTDLFTNYRDKKDQNAYQICCGDGDVMLGRWVLPARSELFQNLINIEKQKGSALPIKIDQTKFSKIIVQKFCDCIYGVKTELKTNDIIQMIIFLGQEGSKYSCHNEMIIRLIKMVGNIFKSTNYIDPLLSLWKCRDLFDPESAVFSAITNLIGQSGPTINSGSITKPNFIKACNIQQEKCNEIEIKKSSEYFAEGDFLFQTFLENVTSATLAEEFQKATEVFLNSFDFGANSKLQLENGETVASLKKKKKEEKKRLKREKKKQENGNGQPESSESISEKSENLTQPTMDVDPGAKPEIIFGSYKMGENDLYRKPHGAFGPGFASFTNKKDVFLIFFHPDETLKVETPTFRPKSSVTSGFLIWNIPADGSYSFTCNGAGNVAPEHIRKKKNWPRILATGAEVTGKFDLKRGDRLEIILGQHGSNWQCGSGGTFVYRSTPTKKELLIAAGGAGGVSEFDDIATASATGTGLGGGSDINPTATTMLGHGGKASTTGTGGAGSHHGGKGMNHVSGSKSYDAGFIGSRASQRKLGYAYEGGFGGGGMSLSDKPGAGGGGGFTGGNGGEKYGGGGGSYTADPNGTILVTENLTNASLNPRGSCKIIVPSTLISHAKVVAGEKRKRQISDESDQLVVTDALEQEQPDEFDFIVTSTIDDDVAME